MQGGDSMREIGAEAIVVNNKNDIHCFRKKEKIIFIGMYSKGWYRFENEGGLIQTLQDYNFEWVD